MAPRAPARRLLARVAYLVVAVTLLAAVLATEPVVVRSTSMTPTLQPGDQLIVDKLTPRFRDLARGDVVVLAPPGSDAMMVKRVVALGGDEVGLEDGRLVVNGRAVPEAYVDLGSVDGVYFGPVAVPRGSVFVMGDDRADSVDSRSFGAVPLDRVVGRVWGGLTL